MNANFYEAELRKSLQMAMVTRHIKDIGDSSPIFSQLMRSYPSMGSKIDWGKIPGSIERSESDEHFHVERFISFFDEVDREFRLDGDVIYVGDSATDFALIGTKKYMRRALPELLEIPQHHYLIGPNCSWCMCFTMEGNMGFGVAPLRTQNH